jgi:hypothetical protein
MSSIMSGRKTWIPRRLLFYCACHDEDIRAVEDRNKWNGHGAAEFAADFSCCSQWLNPI